MLSDMRGDLLLLSTRSMHDYAARVAHQLETFPDFHATHRRANYVGELRPVQFADGEIEVELQSSVRGRDVFLFAQAGRNNQSLTVEQNKMELYHCIDAIRRAQPQRITLFETYCSASRSDRTTRRNSVGFWIHYKTLMSLGVDHIITYQLHSDKSKTVVDPRLCAIDDVPAVPLLQEYIAENFIKTNEVLTDYVQKQWLFCSVDAGGEGIAKKFARAFDTHLVIAHKQRAYNRANTVESTTILSDSPLSGKEVWIVDDMIDTGGSIHTLAQELKKRGVAKVHIAIIHPVFSGPAVDRLGWLYDNGMLDTVLVTDTLDVSGDLKRRLPSLQVVSSARLSAELIMRMNEEQSLSPFFDDFHARTYLSSPKLFM